MALSALPLAGFAETQEEYLRSVTVVNLSAEAHRTLMQDRVQATLSMDATGKTPQEVQEKINAKMQAAKAMYDGVRSVKVSTGGYSVYQQTPPVVNPAQTVAQMNAKSYWQGNQQLTLESADKEALLALAGKLQGKGFAMQGLNYYLSREASDKVRDDLVDEALGNIRERAQRMAKQLGLKDVHFARVDVNGGGDMRPPMPMMARGVMMMDKAESMPAPVAQAGETEVSVNVGVEVHMK